MVLGLYYLTFQRDEYAGPAKAAITEDFDRFERPTNANAPNADMAGAVPTFYDPKEAVMAYETKQVGLQEWVYVRWKGELIRTTVGRVIFNLAFPERWNHEFVNRIIDKGHLKRHHRLLPQLRERRDRALPGRRSKTSVSTTRPSRARPSRSATSSFRRRSTRSSMRRKTK